MHQYRWYVGSTQQSGETVTIEQRKAVLDILLKKFTGVTVYPSDGYWKDPDIQREYTCVFEVIVDTSQWPSVSHVKDVAERLAKAANQKSVLFTSIIISNGGYSDGQPA